MNSLLRNPVLATALSSSIADGHPPEMQGYPIIHLQSPPPAARAGLEALENRASNGASEAPHGRGLNARPAVSFVSVVDRSRHGHVTCPPARFLPPTTWTWLPSLASALRISVAPGTQSFATFSGLWPPGISLLADEGLPSRDVVPLVKKGRRVVAEFWVPFLSRGVHTSGRISTLSSVNTATPVQPFPSTIYFPLFLGNLTDGSRCCRLLSFFRPPFSLAAYDAACSSPSHVTTAATSSAPPTTGSHWSRDSGAEGSSAGTGSAAGATAAAARTAARAATVTPTAALTHSSAGATEAARETLAAAASPRLGTERQGEPTSALDAAPSTDETAGPDVLGTRVAVSDVEVEPLDNRSLNAAPRQLRDDAAATRRVIADSGDHTAATAVPTNVGAAASEWIENSSPAVATCYGAGNNAAAETAAVWEPGTAETSAVAGQRVAAGNCSGAAGLHVTATAEAGNGHTLATAAAFQGAAEGVENVSTFLRGGRAGSGGREWTDTEGGSDGQDEVIFTGSSDALFFPAFPVHRCRGVSLWDVETNERVCLGKFEETGGLLLLTPDTLAKLAVSFRTPFFDGIVLRAFVAPPGGAASTTGHSQAHQQHRPDRHRHPAAPSHHSPAAARSTSSPPSSSTYAASNGRAPASSRSPSGTAVPAAGDEAAAVTEKSSASVSQRAAAPGAAQAVGAPFETVGAVTTVPSGTDVVRASDGEPGAVVGDRRKSVSHKQHHADEEGTGVPSGEATSSVAEEEAAISVSRRTGEARRRNEAHAADGVKAQEYQRKGNRGSIRSNPGGLQSSGGRDKEADVDVRAAHGEGQQRPQPGAAADSYHGAGHGASGERGSSASPVTTGVPATGVPTRIPGAPATAGEGDVLAGGDTGRRRSRHGGLQAHANDASGSGAAENSERTGGRAVASDAQVLADRRARERREPQPLPNSKGSPRVAQTRGRPKAATEGVRALEGVLINPEELLQAMEARHQQHLHASVDGQWMQFERPRQNTEYKLCIGESYWMAMKIPLEACNPFLLNRNEVVVDLVEPQQQQQLPREAAGATGAPQGRQSSRSSGSAPGAAAAATHGQQPQPERRGGRESAAAAVRSKPGATRAGAGGETAADQESSPSRSNNLPSAPDAGSENGEVDRPRSFTGWIGNRVYDRMNWIAASAPTGLTNAVHRLADSLPTTPEEAEELGKKWSEQSLRAARAVSASTKLLMRSFKHAAAELWVFITEGRSGTSSTGGGVS